MKGISVGKKTTKKKVFSVIGIIIAGLIANAIWYIWGDWFLDVIFKIPRYIAENAGRIH